VLSEQGEVSGVFGSKSFKKIGLEKKQSSGGSDCLSENISIEPFNWEKSDAFEDLARIDEAIPRAI